MKNRIGTYDVLRFGAILMVIISHCGVMDIGGGACSVSFFFVLSGFLKYKLVDSNENLFRKMVESVEGFYKKNYKYAFITMLIDLPMQYGLGVIGLNLKSAAGIITSFLLVSSWFTGIPRLNSVTWFLSSLAFCYFISPLFCFFISKIRNSTKGLILIIGMSMFLEIVIEISMMTGGGRQNAYLFTYNFPPTRAIDFLCGMGIKCLVDNLFNVNLKKVNLLQVVSLLVTLLLQLFYPIIFIKMQPLLFIWLPCSALTVFSFGMSENTYISNVLSNSLLQYMGRLSSKLFLFHWIVLVFQRLYIPELNGTWIGFIFVVMISIATAVVLDRKQKCD